MEQVDDNDYRFYSFFDLEARGIVGTRSELHRLITDRNFPKPIKTSGGVQAKARWRVSEVHRWIDAVAANQGGANSFYSVDKPKEKIKPPGRPRKVDPQQATAD